MCMCTHILCQRVHSRNKLELSVSGLRSPPFQHGLCAWFCTVDSTVLRDVRSPCQHLRCEFVLRSRVSPKGKFGHLYQWSLHRTASLSAIDSISACTSSLHMYRLWRLVSICSCCIIHHLCVSSGMSLAYKPSDSSLQNGVVSNMAMSFDDGINCDDGKNIPPIISSIPGLNPTTDSVMHQCMSTPLIYGDVPPLRGDHRPVWAVYGEYLYLPPQRWLHNLEHGAVVMLYHPCADEIEIRKLRHIVTSCLYRHIITPYSMLPPDLPLALVTWGNKLQMNVVNESLAHKFIKEHARIAPENLSKQGQYDFLLVQSAGIVSDIDDQVICP